MDREILAKRLDSFKLPSTRSWDYLHYHYYLKDLKEAFDCYIKENDRVFDIGCGNKPFELYIRSLTKNGEYCGCDVLQSSEQKVDIICEATDIPEHSEKYDVVICTQVIEHVFDHFAMLKEANRLLKQGGFLILSGPFIFEMHEKPYDFYRFTQFGFRELLINAGFQIKEEKANGGKWAVLGQMIVRICGVPSQFQKSKSIIKRFFYASFGKLNPIWNRLFSWLDDKDKNTGDFTLNYVYIAKK